MTQLVIHREKIGFKTGRPIRMACKPRTRSANLGLFGVLHSSVAALTHERLGVTLLWPRALPRLKPPGAWHRRLLPAATAWWPPLRRREDGLYSLLDGDLKLRFSQPGRMPQPHPSLEQLKHKDQLECLSLDVNLFAPVENIPKLQQ